MTQWLTAILAFATTMLVLAIVVSTLVETVHRIFRLRRQGLRLMLENLYAKVIAPQLAAKDGAKLTPTAFADLIMENRATATDIPGMKAGRVMGVISLFFQWVAGSTKLDSISVEIFMEKLADSRILSSAQNFSDEVLKDIGQKYTAFGDEVSTYFESRARLFSVVIAFFVAILLYVHPYNLARAYLANPELAQAVAEKAGDTQAEYAVLLEKLGNTNNTTLTPADAAALQAAIDKLNADIVAGQTEARKLADLGVPIGWPSIDQLKPCAEAAWQADCTFTLFGSKWRAPSFVNALWLLVGGLLIGLGAPFWAQTVSALTVSRETTRKIQQIVGDTPTTDPTKDVAPLDMVVFNEAKAPEPTALRTFKVAQAAKAKSAESQSSPPAPTQTGGGTAGA